MFIDDDSDMKIAGREVCCDNMSDKDSDLFFKQKENGNIKKAKDFGAILADIIFASDDLIEVEHNKKGINDITEQRRILFAFTALEGMKMFTPNSITSRAALAEFYNTLSTRSPKLYEDISSSVSFSFYYLCTRKGNMQRDGIGKTFAMLCGHEDDSIYEELGDIFYLEFLKTIENEANKQAFVF